MIKAEQAQQLEELIGRGHRKKSGSVLLLDFVFHVVKVMSHYTNSLDHQYSLGSGYPIAQY